MQKVERSLVAVALRSQIFFLFFQFIVNPCPDLFNVFPPKSADDMFRVNHESNSSLDAVIHGLLGGFQTWDAQYYLFIAEFGYSIEKMFAFFPLFPLLIRTIASCIPLQSIMSFHTILTISGLLINSVFFSLTAIFVYRFAKILTLNERISITSAHIFILNPARVFFVTNYTESMYSFLVFSAIYFWCVNNALSVILFILASTTRANGIVNAGFFAHSLLSRAFGIPSRRLLSLSGIILCFLPFYQFQLFAYQTFCRMNFAIPKFPPPILSYILEFPNELLLPSTNSHPEWCFHRVPSVYRYIQQHYWENGFLNYYQFIKLPNFILASPVIFFSSYCILTYLKQIKLNILNLRIVIEPYFVHITHLAVLLIFAVTFMNIEVTTRFLFSSSPILYVLLAKLLLPVEDGAYSCHFIDNFNKFCFTLFHFFGPHDSVLSASFIESVVNTQSHCHIAKFFVFWCFLYTILGFLLHCNWYPWT